MEDILAFLIKSGPGYILSAVLFFLYLRSKKAEEESQKALVEKVIGLVETTVSSDEQHRNTIAEAVKALQSVDQRLDEVKSSQTKTKSLISAILYEIRGDATGPVYLDERE